MQQTNSWRPFSINYQPHRLYSLGFSIPICKFCSHSHPLQFKGCFPYQYQRFFFFFFVNSFSIQCIIPCFFFGVSNADKSSTYYSIFTFLYSSDRKYGIKCCMNVQTSRLYNTRKKLFFFYFTHSLLQNTHVNLSILYIYSIKYSFFYNFLLHRPSLS